MAVVSIQVLDLSPVLGSNHPEVEKLLKAAKPANAQALLRYQAWSLSRTLFIEWGAAQLALGLAMLWILMAYMRANRIFVGMVGAMIVLACFAQFIIGPELAYKGRGSDESLVILQALYIGTEALKFVIGVGVAAYAFRSQSGRSSRALAVTTRAPL